MTRERKQGMRIKGDGKIKTRRDIIFRCNLAATIFFVHSLYILMIEYNIEADTCSDVKD